MPPTLIDRPGPAVPVEIGVREHAADRGRESDPAERGPDLAATQQWDE
jgi:hypothetical protein